MHLTHNHCRQPVTLAPITLMAWDSLLLALAPWHTLGTQAALPRVSQKAAGRPVAVGAGWEKVSCPLLAPQFQGGFPPTHPVDFFAYVPTWWPKSHASMGADPAKHRKPLHPAASKLKAQPWYSQEEPVTAHAAPLSIIDGAEGEIWVYLVTAENLAAIFRQLLPRPG